MNPDSELFIILASIILGVGTAFIMVQLLIFLGSILVSVSGFLKERVFSRKYFVVWLKSITGIAFCLVATWLVYYITNKLNFGYDKLDKAVFLGTGALTLIGFLLHVVRKLMRLKDMIETSEFDEIHTTEQHAAGIDDYVRKNIELLRTLQDGPRE